MNTSRANEELDAIDEGVRARSLKEAHEGFALFAEAMGLFYNLILSYTHVSVKTSDEGRRTALGVHRLLMIDAFNSLRAAYKVLLDGYYAQVSLLLRRVIECALRMYFFKKFPDEALLYWKNPDAWYKKYGPSERVKGIDPRKFNANLDIPPQSIPPGKWYVIRNGDYQLYARLFELVNSFFQSLQNEDIFIPYPPSLKARADYLRFQIKTVSEIYNLSNLLPGIGGDVKTLTISPVGITSDETK